LQLRASAVLPRGGDGDVPGGGARQDGARRFDLPVPPLEAGAVSLVAFKAQNHRQQVLAHGPREAVDDRETTPEVFDPLHERFRFTIDVAASPHNAKLPRYYSMEDDGLAQSWAGERVWCNPPYSVVEPWLLKAHAEHRAELIVMLLPANRTEQG
jgi:hypothetical protein